MSDSGSCRELAVEKFTQTILDDPETKQNVQSLGALAAKMRDIILADDNLSTAMFEDGQGLDLLALCPNSTEMLVVTINMITKLPAHELEMMREI